MACGMVSRIAWILAIAVFSLGLAGCLGPQGIGQEHSELPRVCKGLVTIGPDGHYLLDRLLVTEQNTDRINRCLGNLDIPNVRMAGNMSAVLSSRNQT